MNHRAVFCEDEESDNRPTERHYENEDESPGPAPLLYRFEKRCSLMEQSIENMKKLVWILSFLCVIVIGHAAYAVILTTIGNKLPSPDSRLNEVENQLRLIQEHIRWIENAPEEGKDRIRQLNEATEQLERAINNTERILSDTTGTLNRTNQMQKLIHEYNFHKGAVTTAILTIFIAVASIGFYVCMYRPWQPRDLNQANASEVQQALNAVPVCPVLDSTACIISFKPNRSEDYQALVRSALSTSGCADIMHEITKHTDIPLLPHCKMYIMCVEFSERHVIIEEPGLGLADMKMTTYKAVNKLGGLLVILYVNHIGSCRIQDLYSSEIYCVNRQPELQTLETRNRFISTYDQLNDRQKDALKQAVREALN